MRRRSTLSYSFSEIIGSFFRELFNPIPNLGIDIGSYQLRIFIAGKGISLKEKSFVVQNNKNKEYICFGDEAYEMLGKTPPNLKVFQPIERGRIADFDAAMFLVKKCIERALSPYKPGGGSSKFNTVISVPLGLTEVEEMAIMEVARKAGAKKVNLVEMPLAAGFGMEAPVMENTGTYLIDFGGGTTEISCLSLGGVVQSKILKVGGQDLNEALVNYLRIRYGIIVGEKTVEEIKRHLGSVLKKGDTALEISGRSVETGMPKSLDIKSHLLYEALFSYFGQLIDAVHDLVEQTPPELIKDLYQNGLTIIGGSAKITDLSKYLAEELKIAVKTREDSENCVVKGLGYLINHPELLKKITIHF